jgi:hypothetical protein
MKLVPVNIASIMGQVREAITIGRHLRIVGHLGIDASGGLLIIAEHIEAKP